MGSCISSSNPKKKYLDDNPHQQQENFPPEDSKYQKRQKQRNHNLSLNSKRTSKTNTNGYKQKGSLNIASIQRQMQAEYGQFATEQNSSPDSPKKYRKQIKLNNLTKNSTSTYDTNKLPKAAGNQYERFQIQEETKMNSANFKRESKNQQSLPKSLLENDQIQQVRFPSVRSRRVIEEHSKHLLQSSKQLCQQKHAGLQAIQQNKNGPKFQPPIKREGTTDYPSQKLRKGLLINEPVSISIELKKVSNLDHC